MAADDRGLLSVEAGDLVRRETEEIEAVAGTQFRHRSHWQVDLIEAAVVHAPEPIAPGRVQVLNGAVAALEPKAERVQRIRGIRVNRVVTTELVIGLPARNGRMGTIALGVCRSDTGA